MKVISPLSKGVFLGGIGRSDFFLEWGLTQKVVSGVAWEGEVWLFFKVRRCGIISLVVWDGVVGLERGWVYLFF